MDTSAVTPVVVPVTVTAVSKATVTPSGGNTVTLTGTGFPLNV